SINKWGTIVGWYFDAAGTIHGFKRWRRHGHGFSLDFPGAKETFPLSINDQGTIVGFYSPTLPQNEQRHGFIYSNGKWATLDYPSSTLQTALTGISNSALIVGNTSHGHFLKGSFLYQNGVFKVISDPNSLVPTDVSGISPRSGLITGNAGFSGSGGFVATCH